MKPGEPWLELDQDLTQDLRVKDELLRSQRDQVFVETSISRGAQRETLSPDSDYPATEPSRSVQHRRVQFSGSGDGRHF